MTATQLLEKICQGYTFCPAVIAPQQKTRISKKTNEPEPYLSHCADGFVSQQLFTIDIDNAHEKEKDPATGKYRILTVEEGYLTQEDAANICNTNNIYPALVYHTFSSRPDFEKFRICIILSEPVTDNNERLHIMQTLISLFGQAADSGCTNADRTMHGSTPDCTIYVDDTQRTDKQTILNIWANNQANTPPPLPLSPTETSIAPLSPATSSPKLDGYNPSDYDADPDVLLWMINPNACNFQTWTSICAAFKASGGSLQTWMQWCSGYAKDNPTQDRTTYNHLTGESSSIGTLKYYAGQLAPAQYAQYIDDLNHRQHQTIADARQQQQQNTPAPVAPAGNTIAPTLSSPQQQQPKPKTLAEFGLYRIVDLTDAEKTPPEFIVDDMIPVGMTIISGAPKTKKSFFALQMAVAVSNGAIFLNHTTTKVKAVYLDLEGSKSRISSRSLHYDNSEMTNLYIRNDINATLGNGQLISYIRDVNTADPEARLFIIDTFSRARGHVPTNGSNAYDADVALLKGIQKLALEMKVAIVFIHHTKKGASNVSDSFEMASGTMGITGSADCVINLITEGKRADNKAKLEFTPRDVEGDTHNIRFNTNNLKWEMEQVTPNDYRNNPVVRWVMDNAPKQGQAAKMYSYAEIANAVFPTCQCNFQAVKEPLERYMSDVWNAEHIAIQLGATSGAERGVRIIRC
jgi:hypothetical protein